MRAARLYGKEDIRLDEVPEIEADDKHVLVDVEWCGICGSDLHEFTLGMLSAGVANRVLIVDRSNGVAWNARK